MAEFSSDARVTVFRTSDPHDLARATDRLDERGIAYVIERSHGPQWLELNLGAYEVSVAAWKADEACEALADLSSEFKLPIPKGPLGTSDIDP